MSEVEGAPAPVSPERLTVDVIVEAAESLVSADGFKGLSMRKLANACGVGVMTLYGHVPNKHDLLAALADRRLNDLDLPLATAGDWAYRVAAVFHAVRRELLVHPELVPVVAEHRAYALSAYRGTELVFGALREAGLDDAQIISAFGALTSFTVGACQQEIGLTRSAGRSGSPLAGIGALPGEHFSHVIGLIGRLASRDFDAEFSSGLDLLITGLRGWAEEA